MQLHPASTEPVRPPGLLVFPFNYYNLPLIVLSALPVLETLLYHFAPDRQGSPSALLSFACSLFLDNSFTDRTATHFKPFHHTQSLLAELIAFPDYISLKPLLRKEDITLSKVCRHCSSSL